MGCPGWQGHLNANSQVSNETSVESERGECNDMGCQGGSMRLQGLRFAQHTGRL